MDEGEDDISGRRGTKRPINPSLLDQVRGTWTYLLSFGWKFEWVLMLWCN